MAYRFLPPKFVNFDTKPATVNAIEKAIVNTANKAIPSLWKSNKSTSNADNKDIGISTEDNQMIFDIEDIGVTNNTVNKAADKTANGYFAILIGL